MQVADDTCPEGTVAAPDAADAAPAREQARTADDASPVFLRLTWQDEVAEAPATQVTPTEVMFAVVPMVLKRPKEKPAIDTPEMRVIAMRITVARTGEIPFLFPNSLVLIFRHRFTRRFFL